MLNRQLNNNLYGRPEDEEELDYQNAEVSVPASMGGATDGGPVPSNTQYGSVNTDADRAYSPNFIAPLDANGLQAPVAGADGVVPPDTRTEAQKAAGEMEEKRRQYLERYKQAQGDASSSLYSKDGGYQYAQQGDNTARWTDTLLKGAAALFMTGMPAAGIAAAAMTWMDIGDRQHRYKQIGYLEDKGYKPQDIDAWVQTGDHRLLAEDDPKNKYLNVGGGLVFNTETGQYEDRPGGSSGAGGTRFLEIDGQRYYEGGIYNIPGRGYVKVEFTGTGAGSLKPSTKEAYEKQQGTYTNPNTEKYQGKIGDVGSPFQDKSGVWKINTVDGNGRPGERLLVNYKPPKVDNTIQGEDGYYYLKDKEGNQGKLVTLDDAPDEAYTTEGQRKMAGFVRRGTQAINEAYQVMENGFDPTGWYQYIEGNSKFPNWLKTDDKQRYEKAMLDFANAVLRTDTGAAYTTVEQTDAYKYFPQPGDKPETVKQKERDREAVLKSFADGAGGGKRYAMGHIENERRTRQARIDAETKKAKDAADAREKARLEALAKAQAAQAGSQPSTPTLPATGNIPAQPASTGGQQEPQKPYAKGKFGDKYVDLRRNVQTGKIEGRRSGSAIWEVAEE